MQPLPWQRKLRTLLRWMHIKMTGYALLQLLTICQKSAAIEVAIIAYEVSWIPLQPECLGVMLFWIIPQFQIRDGWNRYGQKLEPELPDEKRTFEQFLSNPA